MGSTRALMLPINGEEVMGRTKVSLSHHYLIQLRQIHADHRHISAVAERLYQAAYSHSDSPEISAILTELADYAGGHFLNEERLMDAISYDHSEAHIAEHWKFLGAISVFIAEFENRTLDLKSVHHFVETWVVTHINHYDRDFELFLENSGSLMTNDNRARESDIAA
jgi:hemerythrin-like metal-binding protein